MRSSYLCMDVQIRLLEQEASLADCASRLNLKVIEDQALGVVLGRLSVRKPTMSLLMIKIKYYVGWC